MTEFIDLEHAAGFDGEDAERHFQAGNGFAELGMFSDAILERLQQLMCAGNVFDGWRMG